MAEVSAFRGWRYNADVVDPGLVTAPPYDVITPAAQDFYHDRHPENIIRLILGRDEEPDDDGAPDKYARAARHLADWRRRGILIREAAPAVYLYRQDFPMPDGGHASRTGLIGDLTLSPYAEGVVRPHERTLAKPKEDRLKLMRATGFQLSQVFMLYEDPAEEIRPLLAPRTAQPAADLVDPEGVRHRLWPMTDEVTIARTRAFFAGRPVHIADGHHRYETALAYRAERLASGLPPGEAGKVAVVLAEMDQPGMLVFPTHRLVHSLPAWDAEAFRRDLAGFFHLASFPGGAEELAKEAAAHPHTFGLLFPEGSYLASLTDEASALAAMPGDRSAAWGRLDVSLLHGLILNRLLGLSEETQERQENLLYSREAAEVERMVAGGRGQFGVLLGPTPARQIKEVADAGETMPQKSTYFWPKLLSGLVLKEM